MAIDKNSKAYQSLLNSGYTDEQITQMHSDVAGGQSTQEVVANTQPTTPSSTPTTPTAPTTETATPTVQETQKTEVETVGNTVPEIKQEGELKPLSQDYYNQTSDEALNTIKNNLEGYKQTNPEFFKDYESFKRNFSYNSRNEEQKNLLDTWYKGYEQGLQLSNTPTNDLYTQYKSGQLSNNDLESLRISNPNKYAELQTQINKGNIVAAYDDTTPSESMNFQDIAYKMIASSLNKISSGDYGTSQFFQDYENKMKSREMLDLQDKTTELHEEAKNIEDDIYSMKKQVEEEYAGTGATRAKINAIISDRTYELQQQLRTVNNEYEKYATQYNNRANQYQQEFELQLQEYQLNMQARNQQMDELGFAMDLMNFETNDQRQEREWNYRVKQQEYTNGNINSKDYQTRYKAAIKSVENLLAQYPNIPMQRSAEQMAEDILKAIDNGSNLGAELTKINQQIQQKPEYKYLYNNTFRPTTSSSTGLQSYKVGDTEYVVYNGEMMTAEDFNKRYGGKATGATGTAKPYDIVDIGALSNSRMSTPGGYDGNTLGLFLSDGANQVGKTGGWCGAFVNRYLKSIGVTKENYYDDSLETKLNSVNTSVPRVGSIAVYDYGHITSETGKNHGHVGIVVDVHEDGTYDVIDSNYDSDKKIKIRKNLNPQSSNCKGFFDPSQPPAGTTSTEGATLFSVAGTNGNTGETVSLGMMNLSPTQFDDYVRKYIDGAVSYSEVKSLGDDALNKVTQRALQLEEAGYTPSTKITDPNKIASLESSLRKEYDKATEDAQATIQWVNKMDDAYAQVDENLNAASQALVIAYNKILDESSVVREGEYARTSEGQSLLDKMGAKVKQIAKGGAGITKDNLKSLVDMAHTFSKNAENYQTQVAERAKVSIDKYGLTPEAVLPTNMVNQLYGTTSTTYQLPTSKGGWVTAGGLNVVDNSNTTGAGNVMSIGGYYFPSTF